MLNVQLRFGKPFGGEFIMEAVHSVGREEELHPKIKEKLDNLLPNDIVRCVGWVQDENIRTSAVTGLAIHEGRLFLVTMTKVYVLGGEFYPELIKENPVLSGMWKDLAARVLLRK